MKKPDAIGPDSAPSPQLRLLANSERRIWIAGLCLLCGLLFTVQAWTARFSMNPDGISYLDMAGKLLHGDFSPLMHLYWSPLYPCLLALSMKLFPSAMEFQAAHLANWVIALIALASFTFFLAQYKRGESVVGFRYRTGFAYMLFLWGTVEAIGLDVVTPDLCVAALVYLAAGLGCRLAAGTSRWYITSGLLGLTLGFACLTKSAMAPLGAALLALLAIRARSVPAHLRSLAIAALGFILVFGTYVVVRSGRQHRLTWGDASRLNYAWTVLGEIPVHAGWRGQEPGTGTPTHPPRLLSSDPPVLEFKDTVPATYPLWYDPAYFHEGLRVKFDFRKQVSAVVKSLKTMRWALGSVRFPLLAGLIVLAFSASLRRVWSELSTSWLLAWSLVAFGMYSAVYIAPRYVSGFMVLFWLTAYDGFSPKRLRPFGRGAMGVAAVSILLFQMDALLKYAADTKSRSGDVAHFAVANELSRLGLLAGDEIATVGSAFDAYYARLARVRVAANIGWTGDDGSGNFQPQVLDGAKLNAIRGKLHQLQLKAIVSQEKYVISDGNPWHCIRDSGYCVLSLK